MNNDLISRSELKKVLLEKCCGDCRMCDDYCVFENGVHHCRLIDNAPTVLHDNYCMGYQDGVRQVLKEVAEGKHRPEGKWLIEGGTTLHYVCSECGCAGDVWDKFCKNCGAKMKGGVTNENQG